MAPARHFSNLRNVSRPRFKHIEQSFLNYIFEKKKVFKFPKQRGAVLKPKTFFFRGV